MREKKEKKLTKEQKGALESVKKLDEKLNEHDFAKRKELLVEKFALVKRREQVDAEIKRVNSELAALDRYLLWEEKK